MRTSENSARCLEILAGEKECCRCQPLHEAIVHAARAMGLDGATVVRGVDGDGASGVARKVRLFGHSDGVPFVIWIVDPQERLVRFRTRFCEMLEEADCAATVTEREVEAFRYRRLGGGRDPRGSRS